MTSGVPDVSIVIPCLNEVETVGACVKKAQAFLERHQLRGELIVADNGSDDGSDRLAESLGACVVRVKEKGYGAALMAGIASANGAWVVMGDADDSYDFGAILPFLKKLEDGYDLVVGCRFPRGGGAIKPGAMPWLHRWIGNPVLSFLCHRFFGCPLTDSYCGLRAFRREAVVALGLRATGMEFAYEMVIRASLERLRMAEVPVILSKDGRRSQRSHVRTWSDGWRTLRFMLMYSPRWLFLIPGCGLLGGGMLLGSLLLAGPLSIGRVGFDVNTLLVVAMSVLLGFKLVVFAVCTKVFAVAEGFLPPDRRLERWSRAATLEVGILIGTMVVLIGLGLLGGGMWYWHQQGFGALSYPKSLRLVIPGVAAMLLGAETIFSSFFLSILALPRK